jgi:phage N-6-adenine-methyltransferase
MTVADGRAYMPKAKTDDHPTPRALFELLDAEFHFELDAAASAENAKCATYFKASEDGLLQPWAARRTYCNPPYGSALPAWTAKARAESIAGALVVMLLPVRTSTRWWADHVMRAAEIRLLTGRLDYGDRGGSAPFDSAIVVWPPWYDVIEHPKVWCWDWRKQAKFRERGQG